MKNEQDARALALVAQALAHAHSMLQDAGSRAGHSTPAPENKRLHRAIYRAVALVELLTKRAAKMRDRADGYE